MSIINGRHDLEGGPTKLLARSRPSRRAATDQFADALVLIHRLGWAAPGPLVEGRARHLRERLGAYLDWFRSTVGEEADPIHLSTVAETMVEFQPTDQRQRNFNPWVLDTDFPKIFSLTQARFAGFEGGSLDQL